MSHLSKQGENTTQDLKMYITTLLIISSFIILFNVLKLYSENITGKQNAGFGNGRSTIDELYTADGY
jgi:hypothetical protein